MKLSLCLSLIFATGYICAADPAPNAYLYFDRINGKNFEMCIMYEGHYYTAPMMEHYKYCPCGEEDL